MPLGIDVPVVTMENGSLFVACTISSKEHSLHASRPQSTAVRKDIYMLERATKICQAG